MCCVSYHDPKCLVHHCDWYKQAEGPDIKGYLRWQLTDSHSKANTGMLRVSRGLLLCYTVLKGYSMAKVAEE